MQSITSTRTMKRLQHSPRSKRDKSAFWMPFVLGSCCGFLVAILLLSHLGAHRSIQRSAAQRGASVGYDSVATAQTSGWKQIHVYVGDAESPNQLVEASSIRNDYFFASQWFSQVQQDFVVSRLLNGKRNGYFVDLAANDAVKISNTYALEQNFGWTGLAIEPNPQYWEGLAYRKCHIVAAVIGNSNEDHVFHFPKRAAPKGGLVGEDFDNTKVDKAAGEYRTKTTVTILEVFQRFGTPLEIDYLSLDVEGAEQFVLESFPFDKYRFNIMTIERPKKELQMILISKGYKQVKNLNQWGETLWIHKAIESSINRSALDIDTENYRYRETVVSS